MGPTTPAIRTLQTLIAALIAGIVAFVAVIVVMRVTGPAPARPGLDPLLPSIAAPLWVAGLLAQAFLASAAVKSSRRARAAGALDEATLVQRYATTIIARAALLEPPPSSPSSPPRSPGVGTRWSPPPSASWPLLRFFPSDRRLEEFKDEATRAIA